MLKRNYINVIFIVLGVLIGCLTYDYLFTGLFLFILLGAGISYGVFNIQSSLFVKSICKIKTTEKVVFLTFDDGPSEHFTGIILDTLKEKNIKATFFCIGKNAVQNSQLLLRIDKEGHTIGSHTFSHQWQYPFYSGKKVRHEIESGNEAIFKVTGKKPLLFRPPAGITNPTIANAIKSLNMASIGWSIRSYDTLHRNPEKIINRIIFRLKPGAVILLHDRLPVTAELLPGLLSQIYIKGYKILPLQQFLTTKCYE